MKRFIALAALVAAITVGLTTGTASAAQSCSNGYTETFGVHDNDTVGYGPGELYGQVLMRTGTTRRTGGDVRVFIQTKDVSNGNGMSVGIINNVSTGPRLYLEVNGNFVRYFDAVKGTKYHVAIYADVGYLEADVGTYHSIAYKIGDQYNDSWKEYDSFREQAGSSGLCDSLDLSTIGMVYPGMVNDYPSSKFLLSKYDPTWMVSGFGV